jgi:hypothetical protein
VHTLGNPNFGFARTRFSRRHFGVTGGAETVARALATQAADAPERYVHAIAADDGLLGALLAQPGEAQDDGIVPVPTAAARALLVDKHLLLAAVGAAGFATPPTLVADGPAEAAAAARSLGYPVMLKNSAGAGGTGVRRADAPAGVVTAGAELPAGTLLVQRFIEGRIGCTQLLYDRGRPLLRASYYARDCFPTAFGPSTVHESADHLDTAGIAQALGNLTGFHGLCGFDWIEDSAGRLFFLEFNARPVYLEASVRGAFAAALANMLTGSQLQSEAGLQRAPRSVALFPGHVYFSLQQRRYGDLLEWLPGRSTALEVPWRDPRLLAHDARRIARWCFYGRHPSRAAAARST